MLATSYIKKSKWNRRYIIRLLLPCLTGCERRAELSLNQSACWNVDFVTPSENRHANHGLGRVLGSLAAFDKATYRRNPRDCVLAKRAD